MVESIIVQNINSQIKDRRHKTQDQQRLIEQGLFPKYGLQQLRHHVDVGSSYFNALVAAKRKGVPLSREEKSFCLDYIICISYVYRNNAR